MPPVHCLAPLAEGKFFFLVLHLLCLIVIVLMHQLHELLYNNLCLLSGVCPGLPPAPDRRDGPAGAPEPGVPPRCSTDEYV